MSKVLFNVLAKDLENARKITKYDASRVLVGVMVKNFATDDEVVDVVKCYKQNGIIASVGLGAGDPAMWKRVADVSARALPYHINQVFPAAGYTMGRLQEAHDGEYLVNSLIEPTDQPGMVYIATGEESQHKKEAVSCEMAARMMSDIGLPSVKFYPIDGLNKLENVKTMVAAAVKEGITTFEPTGGINMDNVYEIVAACISCGAQTVIPHLYTSLVDKQTGETNPEYIKQLIDMQW